MTEVPAEVLALARERAARRAERDFAAADAIRDRLAELGWQVLDRPVGFDLVPATTPGPPERVAPAAVASVLGEPPTADASVHWLVQGWPEDVARGVASFRAHEAGRSVQHVVVDAAGTDPSAWPEDVEVLALDRDAGWGTDRNAGLRRAAGDVVLVVDGSVEATGDVLGPIEAALADPAVGVVGPFGIVTEDLRDFHGSDGPEVDAIEGYLMAFRRDVLTGVGMFDERFRFYRSADIEYSFRLKDAGFRAEVVPVPVARHEHRMWAATPAEERARLSKRNFNRFLERFRGRLDLTVAGGRSGPGDARSGRR